MAQSGSAADDAATLAAWLADVDDLDPSTIRHATAQVASTDS
jgi:hypothetical protein